MGTRSLTTFIDDHNDNEIVVMYRQMDGYPETHGKELVEFLDDMHIVNGIRINDERKIANGISCLAAQTVAHFKDGVGHIYLYSAGLRDCGEEYIYTIYTYNKPNNKPKKTNNGIRRNNSVLKIKVHKVYDNEDIFDGTVQEMKDWLKII
jgi:hypothetical protein|tara:strand:- start:751 stop:1200 length:450 start_codon:yes stop_codon:yes gene_type:complete